LQIGAGADIFLTSIFNTLFIGTLFCWQPETTDGNLGPGKKVAGLTGDQQRA
jgi:hypothetical protein